MIMLQATKYYYLRNGQGDVVGLIRERGGRSRIYLRQLGQAAFNNRNLGNYIRQG